MVTRFPDSFPVSAKSSSVTPVLTVLPLFFPITGNRSVELKEGSEREWVSEDSPSPPYSLVTGHPSGSLSLLPSSPPVRETGVSSTGVAGPVSKGRYHRSDDPSSQAPVGRLE